MDDVWVGEIYNTPLDSIEGDLSPHTLQTIYFSNINENKISDRETPVEFHSSMPKSIRVYLGEDTNMVNKMNGDDLLTKTAWVWAGAVFTKVNPLGFAVGIPPCTGYVRHSRTGTGPRLNINTVFPRYRDSHVKDKTVVRHGDPYTGKTTSILRRPRDFKTLFCWYVPNANANDRDFPNILAPFQWVRRSLAPTLYSTAHVGRFNSEITTRLIGRFFY